MSSTWLERGAKLSDALGGCLTYQRGGIFRSVAMQATQGLGLTAFSLVGFIGGIVHGYTRRVHDPRLRWHKNLLTC